MQAVGIVKRSRHALLSSTAGLRHRARARSNGTAGYPALLYQPNPGQETESMMDYRLPIHSSRQATSASSSDPPIGIG
jgi:hypothetical protein